MCNYIYYLGFAPPGQTNRANCPVLSLKSKRECWELNDKLAYGEWTATKDARGKGKTSKRNNHQCMMWLWMGEDSQYQLYLNPHVP